MTEFEQRLIGTKDKFRFVLEAPECWGRPEAYDEFRDRLTRILSTGQLDEPSALSVELGVLRIERMKFNLDCEAAAAALARIVEKAAACPVVKLQAGIITAELALFIEGDPAKAKEIFLSLMNDPALECERFLQGLVSNGMGIALATLGEDCEAEEWYQDALSIFRHIGNEHQCAYVLNNYAVLKKNICAYSESEKLNKRALSLFTSLGVVEGQALSYNNLGVLAYKTGHWSGARYCYERALQLRRDAGCHGNGDRQSRFHDLLLFTEINRIHLLLLQRRFGDIYDRFMELKEKSEAVGHKRHQVLVLEFFAEYCMERRALDQARAQLVEARDLASRIAPESDLMTEVTRRQAQLFLLQKDPNRARATALECIRLCLKIRDKHEMGAALRILAEAYLELGEPRKAVSAFEASIDILKSIGECYELMKSCISYGAHLIDKGSMDADVYLLEAKQLSKKLGLDYFMAQVMLLTSKYEYNRHDFEAATTCLSRATEICDGLQACDKKLLRPSAREWYHALEKAILAQTMVSATKLKSIGRIYEESRFPIEDLKPDLATEVARNIHAECLFLAKRKNSGLRIPLKYNICCNDAKTLLRRQVKGGVEKLFESADPKICAMMNGKTLVSIPGHTGDGYILCAVLEEEKRFTPKDLEFLFASVEALERVAEEYAETPTLADTSDFLEDTGGRLSHPGGYFKDIITLDPELIKTIRLAERASGSTVPILLEGETGVGKELFARAIHAASPRRTKEFIAINSGGIPLNLLESQLFGHVKGAFTDAVTDRTGLIEEARGGTLFFDEVGEMSEELQVKLLRLLENGEYRRLGENAVRYADIRVISATNKRLRERVEKQLFREDLYYRLATVRFRVPPLRERKRDIEFLTRHLLKEGLEKTGKAEQLVHVDMKALEAFELYQWPGNVRELKNEIMRVLSLIGEGEVIRFGMLSERIKDAFQSRGDGGVLAHRVERYERRLILKALEENDWNRSKTADQIGIPRTTLLFKMKQLNIIS